ncbi:MAG: hypothetical protein ACOC10_02275 [Bacteroidota bacterium]
MQKLLVVGPADQRAFHERIISEKTKWTYSGHFDNGTGKVFLPGSDSGIHIKYDEILSNHDNLFFINSAPLPFWEIETAIKRARNIFIENLHTLNSEQLQTISKLLPEIKSTCMAGNLSMFPQDTLKHILPPASPRIIHVNRGIDLTPENINLVLGETIELVYWLAQAECKKTEAININTMNHRFDTLDAKITFHDASVVHILIHPPFPNLKYTLSVFQNNGLISADLLGKKLLLLIGNNKYTHNIHTYSRQEKTALDLTRFLKNIDHPVSFQEFMEKIGPTEILHTLLAKIKRISVME